MKTSVSTTALCEFSFKVAPNKSYNWILKEGKKLRSDYTEKQKTRNNLQYALVFFVRQYVFNRFCVAVRDGFDDFHSAKGWFRFSQFRDE